MELMFEKKSTRAKCFFSFSGIGTQFADRSVPGADVRCGNFGESNRIWPQGSGRVEQWESGERSRKFLTGQPLGTSKRRWSRGDWGRGAAETEGSIVGSKGRCVI